MTGLPLPQRRDAAAAEQVLRALIAVPSVNPVYDARSPGEGGLADALADYGERLGCTTHLDPVVDGRPNVLVRLGAAAEARRTLVIEAHTDTVGATDPAEAVVRDGRIHGRGACDVKGGIAAALLALAELAADPPRAVEVQLLGAIDEEFRFRGITHHLERHEPPDLAVVLEPTGLEVVHAHNGVLRIEVEVDGIAAHTSRAGAGRNAIADAATVIAELHGRSLGPEVAALTVTTVHGGSAINVVPDRCVLGVDIRTAPEADPETVRDAVAQRLAELPGVTARIREVLLADQGMHTDPLHPFVVAALAAAGRVTPVAVPYGTDGSKLARRGVPTIVYGPGSIDDAHSDHESVAIDDLVAAAGMLVALVRALDADAAP